MDILSNLSLFSGAGGLDLGAKLVGGFRTVAYVEYDRYAQGVLMSRMRSGELDDAPIFEDVRTFDGRSLAGSIDVISGGFPCQDVSHAGKRAGLKGGTRSGLWSEYARLIREIRPRFVLAENVLGLLSADDGRGYGTVLRDLASLGYDAEWRVRSAASVGAPHLRERVFIVAYAVGQPGEVGRNDFADAGEGRSRGDNARRGREDDWRESDSRQDGDLAHSDGGRRLHGQAQELPAECAEPPFPDSRNGGSALSHADCTGRQGPGCPRSDRGHEPSGDDSARAISDATGVGRGPWRVESDGQQRQAKSIEHRGEVSFAADALPLRRERQHGDVEEDGGGWSHFQRGAEGDERWRSIKRRLGRTSYGLEKGMDDYR